MGRLFTAVLRIVFPLGEGVASYVEARREARRWAEVDKMAKELHARKGKEPWAV
jgi:hypothetical protein